MKQLNLARGLALFVCTFGLMGMATGLGPVSIHAQEGGAYGQPQQQKNQGPNVSEGEAQAIKKINEAKTTDAKLQAAAEFIKKYPKSKIRPQLAAKMADQVRSTQDPAQKVAGAQAYLKIFTEPSETDAFQPVLIWAYADNKQLDEAFTAASWLDKHPEDVELQTHLALVGSNEAGRGNPKFLQQSQTYGMKAIELIEANKKPAGIEDARWAEYRTRWLPALYREMGIVALRLGDKDAGRARMEKAAALKSDDPSVYAILGGYADQEYTAFAQQYKNAPSDEVLKKAQAQMDRAIELYAQAIALSGDKPEYKQVVAQLTPVLESYYKFRHNGSTEGLQQLIDKYKKAP